MTEDRLSEVLMLFQENTQVIIPDESIGADWHKEGWICFYYYPFELGVRFPFSELVKNTLTDLHVSPGQLMPSAWRVLACLDAVESKHGLGINVEVLKRNYFIKKFNGCRFGLSSRKKDDPLIFNLDIVNDRGWKNDFFFVAKDTLPGSTDFLLDRWHADGNYSFYILLYFC